MRESIAKVSMCSLENGCCERQIPYDMTEHDKILYQEGYVKAIDDFAKKLIGRLEEEKILLKKNSEQFANTIYHSLSIEYDEQIKEVDIIIQKVKQLAKEMRSVK